MRFETKQISIHLKKYGTKLDLEYYYDTHVNLLQIDDINDKTFMSQDRIYMEFGPDGLKHTAGTIFQHILRHLCIKLDIGPFYDTGKLRQYSYIRSNWAAKILYGYYLDCLKEIGISWKDTQTFRKIRYRNTFNKRGIADIAINLKLNQPDNYEYFKSDMMKFTQGVGNFVIFKLQNRSHLNYQDVLKDIPKQLHKCKGVVHLGYVGYSLLDKGFIQPETLLQFRYLSIISSGRASIPKNIIELTEKITLDDVKYYKDRARITGHPHSSRVLSHLSDLLKDGCRIAERFQDNEYDIQIDEMTGSPRKLIQKAIFNHNQQRLISREEIGRRPNWNMLKPPIELPKWIEDIRLKTAHDLINSGEECNHCLGSYTYSRDIFVREGDICAQIYRNDYKVGQCYDKYDKITDESEELRQRLEKALKIVRENNKESFLPKRPKLRRY